MRFFNTAGPVNPTDHYCLPPLERFDLDSILSLIRQKKYFILHAPRQVGKTSYLLALMAYLNQQDEVRVLDVNVEGVPTAHEDMVEAMQAILSQLALSARLYLQDPFLQENKQRILAEAGEFAALDVTLPLCSEQRPQPLVLLIDEIDALVGDALVAVLCQLWAGYTRRPQPFPQNIILCGVRDICE